MTYGRCLVFSGVLALALTSSALAQSPEPNDVQSSPPKQTEQKTSPAPIIITRPDGEVSIDPQDTDAIEDTVGRDPKPGASQAMHCPGGQTISQAQGDVRNVTCD